MRNYDKEILGYEVLFRRTDELDGGEDIVDHFQTVEEAISYARYIEMIGFCTEIRIHQINAILWE